MAGKKGRSGRKPIGERAMTNAEAQRRWYWRNHEKAKRLAREKSYRYYRGL